MGWEPSFELSKGQMGAWNQRSTTPWVAEGPSSCAPADPTVAAVYGWGRAVGW